MAQETRYVRSPDFVYRTIVGEAVLVPIRRQVESMDCIYTMNAAGACIWECLEDGATPAELQAAVLGRFEADPESVAADVAHFLAELEAAGAVQRA